MKSKLNKKETPSKRFLNSNKNGFSTNELVVVITIIGILSTLVIPNFAPALEFIEVLIAERYLLGAVKECQIGILNQDINPQYSLPNKEIGLGLFKKNKYIISHTGISEECLSLSGGNILRVSKLSGLQGNPSYSLDINVVSGSKSYEGSIPSWLYWWSGKYSPVIPENDSYFNR